MKKNMILIFFSVGLNQANPVYITCIDGIAFDVWS